MTSTDRPALDYIFHPRSVAVVGASASSAGGQFVDALKSMPFQGSVYPVNPKMDIFMDLPCFPSLTAIPGPVDHVVSSVPALALTQVVEDCGAKGVKVLHLFTSGLEETGQADRAELQQGVAKRARELGMRVIGPNCLGLFVPSEGIAWISGLPKEPGPIAFISQSGANAAEFLFVAATFGLRFSKVMSYGNAVDLNESDFFDYCADDPDTEIVLAYIEGVKDGRRFRQALTKAASRKPVVILKGGRTEAGSRAVQSHTASMAGSIETFEALCRQAGAVVVNSMEELQDMAVAFRFVGRLAGPRAGVVSGGGGRSVLSADELTAAGFEVPQLTQKAQEKLREFTPSAGTSVRNPVDTSVMWIGGELAGDLLARTIKAVASSDNVDFVILEHGVQFGPRRSWQSMEEIPNWLEVTLTTGLQKCAGLGKPLLFSDLPVCTPEAFASTLRFREVCARQGVGVFPGMRRTVQALARLLDWQERAAGRESARPSLASC
jgi:acyl-CoA synthetase (NDP forming)